MIRFTYIWENSYQKIGMTKTIDLNSEEEFNNYLADCNKRFSGTSWNFSKHPTILPYEIFEEMFSTIKL